MRRMSERATFQACWTIHERDRSCRMASRWISSSISSGKYRLCLRWSVPAIGRLAFLAQVRQGRLARDVVDGREGLDALAGNSPRLLHHPGKRPVLPRGLFLNLPEHLLREVQRL